MVGRVAMGLFEFASIRSNLADGYTDADRIWEIDSPSHNLMITDAEETTEMLLRLASL